VVAPVDSANGVGLSPDGRTLYVAQAAYGRLMAYDLDGPGKVRPDPKTGEIGRVLAQMPGGAGFDSLGVDSAGYVCCATTRTGHVTVVAPDGSGYTQVDVGDGHITNICWGGPDLKTAYLTLVGFRMLAAMEWPRPGLGLHFLNR
jgi:gluconolactonase